MDTDVPTEPAPVAAAESPIVSSGDGDDPCPVDPGVDHQSGGILELTDASKTLDANETKDGTSADKQTLPSESSSDSPEPVESSSLEATEVGNQDATLGANAAERVIEAEKETQKSDPIVVGNSSSEEPVFASLMENRVADHVNSNQGGELGSKDIGTSAKSPEAPRSVTPPTLVDDGSLAKADATTDSNGTDVSKQSNDSNDKDSSADSLQQPSLKERADGLMSPALVEHLLGSTSEIPKSDEPMKLNSESDAPPKDHEPSNSPGVHDAKLPEHEVDGEPMDTSDAIRSPSAVKHDSSAKVDEILPIGHDTTEVTPSLNKPVHAQTGLLNQEDNSKVVEKEGDNQTSLPIQKPANRNLNEHVDDANVSPNGQVDAEEHAKRAANEGSISGDEEEAMDCDDTGAGSRLSEKRTLDALSSQSAVESVIGDGQNSDNNGAKISQLLADLKNSDSGRRIAEVLKNKDKGKEEGESSSQSGASSSSHVPMQSIESSEPCLVAGNASSPNSDAQDEVKKTDDKKKDSDEKEATSSEMLAGDEKKADSEESEDNKQPTSAEIVENDVDVHNELEGQGSEPKSTDTHAQNAKEEDKKTEDEDEEKESNGKEATSSEELADDKKKKATGRIINGSETVDNEQVELTETLKKNGDAQKKLEEKDSKPTSSDSYADEPMETDSTSDDAPDNESKSPVPSSEPMEADEGTGPSVASEVANTKGTKMVGNAKQETLKTDAVEASNETNSASRVLGNERESVPSTSQKKVSKKTEAKKATEVVKEQEMDAMSSSSAPSTSQNVVQTRQNDEDDEDGEPVAKKPKVSMPTPPHLIELATKYLHYSVLTRDIGDAMKHALDQIQTNGNFFANGVKQTVIIGFDEPALEMARKAIDWLTPMEKEFRILQVILVMPPTDKKMPDVIRKTPIEYSIETPIKNDPVEYFGTTLANISRIISSYDKKETRFLFLASQDSEHLICGPKEPLNKKKKASFLKNSNLTDSQKRVIRRNLCDLKTGQLTQNIKKGHVHAIIAHNSFEAADPSLARVLSELQPNRHNLKSEIMDMLEANQARRDLETLYYEYRVFPSAQNLFKKIISSLDKSQYQCHILTPSPTLTAPELGKMIADLLQGGKIAGHELTKGKRFTSKYSHGVVLLIEGKPFVIDHDDYGDPNQEVAMICLDALKSKPSKFDFAFFSSGMDNFEGDEQGVACIFTKEDVEHPDAEATTERIKRREGGAFWETFKNGANQHLGGRKPLETHQFQMLVIGGSSVEHAAMLRQ